MTPNQIHKLQAAWNFAAQMKREGVEPKAIIAELVSSHGAKFDRSRDPKRLRVAGVLSTCTAGEHGLLANWMSAAGLRLIQARMGVGS